MKKNINCKNDIPLEESDSTLGEPTEFISNEDTFDVQCLCVFCNELYNLSYSIEEWIKIGFSINGLIYNVYTALLA